MELSRDDYGYTWLVSRRTPGRAARAGQRSARGEQRAGGQRVRPATAVLAGRVPATARAGGSALVYLYKRGTFYPFAPLPGTAERRDNALELQVRAVLGNDLRIEQDLGRWFPVWGAPGL